MCEWHHKYENLGKKLDYYDKRFQFQEKEIKKLSNLFFESELSNKSFQIAWLSHVPDKILKKWIKDYPHEQQTVVLNILESELERRKITIKI